MSETGAEVRVHRTLLGLYTDQWRQNLQALDSTELVFLLQGVGHLELEELLADISTNHYSSQKMMVIKKILTNKMANLLMKTLKD